MADAVSLATDPETEDDALSVAVADEAASRLETSVLRGTRMLLKRLPD